MERVTVVIPTYYRNESLRGALESVEKNAPPVSDAIVVDGSGAHQAEDTVTSFQSSNFELHYIAQNKDRGVAAARDEGIANAETEWIRFLDDDDVLVDGAVQKQLQKAESTDAEVVYGAIGWPDDTVILPDPEVQGDVLRRALEFDMAPCVPSTMLIRRELLEDVGPTTNLPSDDHALDIELAQRTEYQYVDELVARRTGTGKGLGSSIEVAERRAETFKEYRTLYDDFPDSVSRRAKARIALRQSDARIEQHGWSLMAIYHATKFAWYDRSMISLAFFIATLGGKPLVDFGRSLIR